MEILSILTGAFVAGCDLGIKKYTEENVRDGEERRIWKGKKESIAKSTTKV